MMNKFWVSLAMSTFAGGATTVGALSIFCLGRHPNNKHLAFALASAAGVMLTVSLCDLMVPLILEDGFFYPTIATSLGWISFSILESMIPDLHQTLLPVDTLKGKSKPKSVLNLLTSRKQSKCSENSLDETNSGRSLRVGMIMLLTLTLHNFPEGLAVGVSTMKSESVGFDVTVAIALHNIPEGLAIAIPLYAATKSRRYAIGMASLSGLSEPVGALAALTLLAPFFEHLPWLISYVLIYVAGIMIAVSLRELIPEAIQYREFKAAFAGYLAGTAVMLYTIYIVPV